MGNICRSPAAEGTFRQLLKQEGVERHIECDSAGTIDYHTGAGPDARMRSAARERGITIAGSARQIAVADLARFDLILCMDGDNLEHVEQLAAGGKHRARIRLFCEFVNDCDAREVPDPYYGGSQGFDDVWICSKTAAPICCCTSGASSAWTQPSSEPLLPRHRPRSRRRVRQTF